MATVTKIGSADLDHMVRKARDAEAGGFGVLSTGERLVVALILNRPDWLAQMDYTIAEAIACRTGMGAVDSGRSEAVRS